jgi:hypothetical protein
MQKSCVAENGVNSNALSERFIFNLSFLNNLNTLSSHISLIVLIKIVEKLTISPPHKKMRKGPVTPDFFAFTGSLSFLQSFFSICTLASSSFESPNAISPLWNVAALDAAVAAALFKEEKSSSPSSMDIA